MLSRTTLIGAALALAAGMFSGCENQQTPTAVEVAPAPIQTDEDKAIAMARKLILKAVKYPDDSTFPDERPTASKIDTTTGATIWSVAGKIKTPNGFGANLTHPYKLLIHQIDAERYRAIHVEIGDTVAIDGSGEMRLFNPPARTE